MSWLAYLRCLDYVSVLTHIEPNFVTGHLFQIMTPRLFAQPFIQAQTKENILAPRHRPLWGETTVHVNESTGDRWSPLKKSQQSGKCFHLMTLLWAHYLNGWWSIVSLIGPLETNFNENSVYNYIHQWKEIWHCSPQYVVHVVPVSTF